MGYAGLALSEDGSILVAGDLSHVLVFVNTHLVTYLSVSGIRDVAITLDGTKIIVTISNQARVYLFNGSTLTLVQSITVLTTGSSNMIYPAISSGNTLVLGNPAYNRGTVWVYTLSNGTYVQEQTLNSPYLNDPAGFGTNVQLTSQDERLVVQSYDSTYIYSNDGTMTLVQTILNMGFKTSYTYSPEPLMTYDGTTMIGANYTSKMIHIYNAPAISVIPPADNSTKTLDFGVSVFGNVSSSNIPYFSSRISEKTPVVYSLEGTNTCLYIAQGALPSSNTYDFKQCSGSGNYVSVKFEATATDYFYSRVTSGGSTSYVVTLSVGVSYTELK